MLVHAQNISKQFAYRTLFTKLSFTIHKGEYIVLLGENGAGKTTLLSLIAGLLPYDTGAIRYGIQKKDFALLGHQTFIYPSLTALENLSFWNTLYEKQYSKKQLFEMLEYVGLVQFADEKADIFSRGMAQRLSLARVKLIDPILLLLDEPDTGLDKRSQAILHNYVLEKHMQGTSILWVSHAPKTLLPHATHMYYIHAQQSFVGTKDAFLASNFVEYL